MRLNAPAGEVAIYRGRVEAEGTMREIAMKVESRAARVRLDALARSGGHG
jgi:hypothetical protein